MSFRIICPYCFEEMQDDEVLFRSERVSRAEQDILPNDYEDIEEFRTLYRGSDKDEILNRYREWEFFAQRDPFSNPNDPYKRFWDRFTGTTTEEDLADEQIGLPAYQRPVIDPKKKEHQRYLRIQPDESYFIRDKSGMVAQIELKTGERCNRRVCRHCHNPLPDGYGRNPVKFVTLIGVTGAGKTVYLAQTLRKMSDYTAKVGLDSSIANPGVATFMRKNVVAVNRQLPGSTPFKQFQQPLSYEIVGRDENNVRTTETFVLYDVAGELFQPGSAANLTQFAPFIEHADGIIFLIDPMQIEVIAEQNGEEKGPAVTALDAIHTIVTDGNTEVGCTKPIAVCLSQIDRASVQAVLDEDLRRMLNASVEPVRDDRGDPMPVFNALQHLPVAEKLEEFMRDNQWAIVNRLRNNYPDHDYFAFTSLGCDVVDRKPVGPIIPKRIEEPLYWLFYKLGFLQTNEVILPDCPVCGTNENTYELPSGGEWVRRGFLRGRNWCIYGCKQCGKKW